MPGNQTIETTMNLILWRHAEAEDPSPYKPDSKRRLTPRGEKQAYKMAAWLGERLPRKTVILVSPTERTQETAHALGLPFEIEPRIGVDASASDLLNAAEWPEGNQRSNTVVLIGHQPALGRAASLVLAGTELDWSIKKGAVWWIASKTRGTARQFILKAVTTADSI